MKPDPPPGKNPSARLRLLAALSMALALIAVGIYGWRLDLSHTHLRDAALAQLETRATELATAIAEQTEATIRTADFGLLHLRDEYEDKGLAPDEARMLFKRFPPGAIVQVAVIDASGYLEWSSIGDAPRVYLGDREHFRAHLEGKADTLFISHPVLGRASGLWSIQLSRPLRRHGRFAGVMVLSLAPHYLAETHRQMALSGRNIIALFRPDGTYLARTPKLEESLGKSVPLDRPFLKKDAPARGSFRIASTLDNVHRTYAWQRGRSYPVTINVGLDEAAVLAPLQHESALGRLRAVIGGGLTLLLAALVSVLLWRAARHQEALAASEMRHRSFFEKNASVKLVVDPQSGQIVDANPAASHYYGYPRETLLSLRIDDLNCLPAQDMEAEMARAHREQRLFFNFRHRLASGAERDVEVYSGPVDLDGKTLLFSIVHDVTARRELEQRLAASEALHRSLFLTLAEGVVVVRADGSLSAWNEAALAILGVGLDGLQARQCALLDVDGRALALDELPSMRALRGEYLDHVLFRTCHPSGRKGWIFVSSRPLQQGGQTDGEAAVLSFSDITALVEAEESLRVAQSVFDVASEAILVTDAEQRIIAVNPAFSELTGYGTAEVLGRKPSLLASGAHGEAFFAQMWGELGRAGRWEGEISNRRKDGRTYIAWLRISVVPELPGHGRRYVALFSDITERKREADAVWHQANFDALTGLANRKLLEDRLTHLLAQAQRQHSAVAVLFIDLDRFKEVNDEYGHATGDALLQQVARRLESCLRAEDTIARLGGDEFVAVLPALAPDSDAPGNVAGKILRMLSAPFPIGPRPIRISCSIGISLFPRHASSADTLMARADAAMYDAKQAGRHTWRSV